MLKENLKEDLNKAVKGKKEINCSVLRLVLAAISNREKEKKYKGGEEKLTDEEVLEVIVSEAKKRKEAILEFEKAERNDLVDKEKAELDILQQYLPEQLSDEEIKGIVDLAINESSAKSLKDMGKVMSLVMGKVKGRADGSRVNQIVKELLS